MTTREWLRHRRYSWRDLALGIVATAALASGQYLPHGVQNLQATSGRPQLAIYSVTPNTGLTTGTPLTIIGANFEPTSQFCIGGMRATMTQYTNSTEVHVLAPDLTNGTPCTP